jgi:hypothetical protein
MLIETKTSHQLADCSRNTACSTVYLELLTFDPMRDLSVVS